jgi:hypothetical protein
MLLEPCEEFRRFRFGEFARHREFHKPGSAQKPRLRTERHPTAHRYLHDLTQSQEAVMRMKDFAVAAAAASMLVLAGCGTSTSDRALSGGLLGAGAGAAIGSVTGSAGTGAVIGGVAGAALGAATSPCDLDLGNPVWRDHGGRRAYERRCGHPPPD